MLNDKVKLSLNYFRLKKYLISDLGYEEGSAVSAIGRIRNMEPDIKRAFLTWFTTGDIPAGDFHGIDIENLMLYRQLNPVAAFLAVDWYVKEPETAYSLLSMPLKDSINKTSPLSESDIDKLCSKYSIKRPEPSENTEDITG